MGLGALARYLNRAGHVLVADHDLPDDARVMRHDVLKDEDVIAIFNPPYWGKPRDLHALIGNFSDHTTFWGAPTARLGSERSTPPV